MNIVKPELKRLHSPDIYDLRNPSMDESKPFCILVQAMFGPEDVDGEESFDFLVCNRLWVEGQRTRGEAPDEYQFIVDRFDVGEIEEHWRKIALKSSGNSWKDVATKLGRFGRWEFEDYIE